MLVTKEECDACLETCLEASRLIVELFPQLSEDNFRAQVKYNYGQITEVTVTSYRAVACHKLAHFQNLESTSVILVGIPGSYMFILYMLGKKLETPRFETLEVAISVLKDFLTSKSKITRIIMD